MDSKVREIFIFVFALSLCQNVIYVMKIGNTYLNICQVLAVLYVFGTFLQKGKIGYIKKSIRLLHYQPLFVCFVLSIFLSVITMLFYPGENYFVNTIKGLIVLSTSITVCGSTYNLAFDKVFLRGLIAGYFINVIFSALQYVSFNSGGMPVTLAYFFPQNFYYVCMQWAQNVLEITSMEASIYSYRASGLFLECSHYVVYSSLSFLLIYRSYSALGKLTRRVFAVLTVINSLLIVVSMTGNIIIYCIALVFPILVEVRKSRKKTNNFIIACAFLLIVMSLLVVFNENVRNIFNTMMSSFGEANITDGSNSGRSTGWVEGFMSWLYYPIGVGYNNAAKFLLNTATSHSTFNYPLSILLETGIFGLIAYLWSFYKNIKIAKRNGNQYAVVAMIILFLIQFGSGQGLIGFILCPVILFLRGSENQGMI